MLDGFLQAHVPLFSPVALHITTFFPPAASSTVCHLVTDYQLWYIPRGLDTGIIQVET